MASLKRGALVASTLMLIAVVISACNQPYSQQPSVTNTPIDPNSLFGSPIAQTPGGMGEVEAFGTQTALALTGTPLAGLVTQDLSTPLDAVSQGLTQTAIASTPIVSTIPAFTPTATLAVGGTQPTAGAPTSSGPLPTSAPVGSRPATYTLRSGEFPYCIARRFDVDPDALLRLNSLSSGTILYPNRTLQIPQSGSFPGTRALRNHPTTYTASAGQTVYSVACLFGDVDPAAIAQANNISVDATLTAGQTLSIP
ncbi:MAG TPA: LysM peptidoglycan-binding domain-containing protein [Anaerolineales bacterium]|nr:LysM peptidoglycan-binding domain-containing protein [Anaerolineales bacterium]